MILRTSGLGSEMECTPAIPAEPEIQRLGIIYCEGSLHVGGVPASVCWATINTRDEIAHGILRIAEIPLEGDSGSSTLPDGFLTPEAAVRALNRELSGARLQSDFIKNNSRLRALYRRASGQPSWINESHILSRIWEDLSIHVSEGLSFKTFGPTCVTGSFEERAISFVEHYREARWACDVMTAAVNNFQRGRNFTGSRPNPK